MSMARLAEPPPVAGGPDPMLPRMARVDRVRREGADVWTIEIACDDAGFAFAPGQFNMLYAFGVGEIAISISGDPATPQRLVHTIRAVGRVSEALTRLRAGDIVGIRGPFGRGWPVEEAYGSDIVVVAGGLGLAPLRPAIHHVLNERQRYGRFVLLYGTRSPDDILFPRELERWRGRLDVDLGVTVDHAGGDWRGNVGVVTTLIPRRKFEPEQTIALVCGPEIMMRFAITALTNAGLPERSIYLSMERNMKCALGFCGHCQFGGSFICKDGPVYSYDQVRHLIDRAEI
jgi:NAD(P)H-flavin reductase